MKFQFYQADNPLIPKIKIGAQLDSPHAIPESWPLLPLEPNEFKRLTPFS
jgi:hypothetical protein